MAIVFLRSWKKINRKSKEVIYNFYTPKRKRQKKDKQSLFMQAVIEIHMLCVLCREWENNPPDAHTKK